MSKKSAKRVKSEEELLAEFVEEQKQKRKDLIKRVLVIILCIALVIAFCFPAIATLIPVM